MEDTSLATGQPKWWLSSQTVQGSLLSIAPIAIMVLHQFGVSVGNDEANTIIGGIAGLAGMFGVLMSIEGRFRAAQPITLSKPQV